MPDFKLEERNPEKTTEHAEGDKNIVEIILETIAEEAMRFLDRVRKIIKKIEDSKVPFIYFIITFFCATTLRHFLEMVSDKTNISFNIISHYYSFWTSLLLALIIFFHFITKEKIEKIARLILPSFLITTIAPVIDLIISSGKGYDMAYMGPWKHGNLFLRFFTFFGSFKESGITPGMRIEIGLVILGIFIYFLIKKIGFVKSLLFSFLSYSLIFLWTATPFVIKFFSDIFKLGFDGYSSILMRSFHLLLIFIFGVWLFYLHNKRYFIEIIKDIRIFRLLSFELMFVLGIASAGIFSPDLITLVPDKIFYLFYCIFIMVGIMFVWLFSVITNNIADYEIDKITNKARPSVSKTIPMEHYKLLAWIFLLLSIIYSSAVDFKILFLILLFAANYFLYSMPPFRLKRIPFFSKLFISMNLLASVMLGYVFVTQKLSTFPINISLIFLILFTPALNFIDLKDYEGDKAAGIKTLPVILGLKKSKMIIGSFFLISYPMAQFLLQDINLLPILISLGIIQFFFINRKNYSEKPVFIIYLLTIMMVIIYFSGFKY